MRQKKKTRLITRNCLEVTQLENKINQIEKNILDVHSLRENYKEFINKGKLIWKWQRRFTEEVNKIALSSNHDKIIQSIDSLETDLHRTSKDIVCTKEKSTVTIL